MDKNYAKLSFYAGICAGAADRHLGADQFRTLISEQSWELTWDKLDAWKEYAITLGVPRKVMEPSMQELWLMPIIVEASTGVHMTEEEALEL